MDYVSDYQPLVTYYVFQDTGNEHVDHCARCHLSKCPFVENFNCPIVACPLCHIWLHECKVKEHVEEICPKTQIPCLNAGNGCPRIVRRFRLHHHLLNCPANIVVCTREWARKTLSNETKLRLKAMAKGVLPTENVEIPDDQLDLAAASSDQKVLLDSYSFRRKHRVSQRDRLHRNHPLVPLRPIYDMEGHQEMAGGHEVDGDSSEEEREARAAKLRSKKAMFANCYMCQVDPATQHLHTLGSESVKYKLGRPVRKWPRQEDKFHSAHNLMIDFSIASTTEDSHLLFRKTLYIRRCLRVFHRREVGNHEISQHQTGLDNLGQLVVRCPNWQSGCSFRTSRLKPKEGRLRFQKELDTIICCPTEEKPQQESSLANQPDWVIFKLAEYLPSSALNNLSRTSKALRVVLRCAVEERLLVDVRWKRTTEGWKTDGFKHFFSIADDPVPLCWQPAVGLSEHLADCQFGERKSIPEGRVLALVDMWMRDSYRSLLGPVQ